MKRSLLLAALGLAAFGTNAQEQRVPLFEVFTSSTCPPCKPGNEVFKGVIDSKPANEYVAIKFQQNFPVPGDPYASAEAVARRGYYAINSVPRLEIDGGWDGNGNSFTNTLYNNAKAVPATFQLSGTYSINGKSVSATVKYKPLEAGTNTVLYVAIIETETVQNKKNNGELKFYNVMKKFMPSNSGTNIASTPVNTEETKTLTFDFKGDFRLPANGRDTSYINDATEHSVENFANLRVVAWVQGSDKKVYQAANLTKAGTSVTQVSNTVGSVVVYPNPASNLVKVDFDMVEADFVSASLVSLTGAVVKSQNVRLDKGQNQIAFNTEDLASGMYNLIIFDSKNNSFAQRVVIGH